MRKKVKPNFMIIGAAKAATTSLSSLLALHPQAAIARVKEPHFFSFDHHYKLGWKKYLKLFECFEDRAAIGEASTSYSRIRYYPLTVSRIKEHLPRTKIIYMVRHPLERMESAYVEHMGTPGGQVFSSVNDAVRRQPMVLDSSRYWEVFDAYRQQFEESRIKIVWFEEYASNSAAVFKEVCRFLEIDETVVPDPAHEQLNSRDNARARMGMLGLADRAIDTKWDQETRTSVINQLREDNCRFLDYFGKPRNYWGDLF